MRWCSRRESRSTLCSACSLQTCRWRDVDRRVPAYMYLCAEKGAAYRPCPRAGKTHLEAHLSRSGFSLDHSGLCGWITVIKTACHQETRLVSSHATGASAYRAASRLRRLSHASHALRRLSHASHAAAAAVPAACLVGYPARDLALWHTAPEISSAAQSTSARPACHTATATTAAAAATATTAAAATAAAATAAAAVPAAPAHSVSTPDSVVSAAAAAAAATTTAAQVEQEPRPIQEAQNQAGDATCRAGRCSRSRDAADPEPAPPSVARCAR